MISVTEATAIILSNTYKPKKEIARIENATGRISAEPIYADRDFPPFDRATMDGIALNAHDVHKGTRSFLIEGIQAAGKPAATLSNHQHCFEIMTGAPLPLGTNAVVRYEDISIQNGTAHLTDNKVKVGDNIHFRGTEATENSLLMEANTRLSPAEIALLASVGKPTVAVFSHPSIAVISTGDELVAIADEPLPHQIRTSNAYALQAALHEMGCASTLFHLADNEQTLSAELAKIVTKYHVIILSGGVSKGKFDFVPTTLESLGINKLFHQISQKPGKPMWFGRSSEVFVFALPGNPVSTFMCFHRYVKPWLLKSLGAEAETHKAILSQDFAFKPPLTYFVQVNVKNEDGKLLATPVVGGGSGDFVNLKEVNGFLELPSARNEFKAGEAFPLIKFR